MSLLDGVFCVEWTRRMDGPGGGGGGGRGAAALPDDDECPTILGEGGS